MFFNFNLNNMFPENCFCMYIKRNEVGSHEFSWNQKIVTDSFPRSLGMKLKNCYPWDLKS